MRIAIWLLLFMFARPALALQGAICDLEYNGEESSFSVRPDNDALNGLWKEAGPFKLRALLAAPDHQRPWLLVEVHALAPDNDYRMISSQKVRPPFTTGQVEVIEPRLGRSLYYKCWEAP